MEGDNRNQYYTQDSLAVEMLSKLQNSSGFTTVALPETFSLHPSLQPGVTSTLSMPLLNPSASQAALPTGLSSDSVLLSSVTGLDSALTQFLVAAQSGNPVVSQGIASSTVSSMPPVLAPCASATLPSSGAQTLHPVLSASLAPVHPSQPSAEVPATNVAPPAPVPEPVAGSSSETMIITVHCTTSDTVIVVGQHNWQCCMCRDVHGFDTSIDHHLASKHNLLLRPSGAAPEETVGTGSVAMKEPPSTAGYIDCERSAFLDSSVRSSSSEPLQTISQQALSSLQTSESTSTRSGLEREVALLMAQTFTHSGTISADSEEVNKESNISAAGVSTGNQDKLKHEPVCANNVDGIRAEQTSAGKDAEVENVMVYDKMINKVERAILSTIDSRAKNDLLLVATELARMQKDLTSKRRQMKRNHRYIQCPECGKEVRNRKDLIRQHERCHEKIKKYRCLICNKMFKYAHTLRRHVLQQGHKGGMLEELNVSSPQDHVGKEVNLSDVLNFEKLVKAETENDSDAFITVDLSSLSSEENKTVSSASRKSHQLPPGVPAYEKIRDMLLSKGQLNRTPTGKKLSLLQCFVCDREIRNRNYYITRHARCHMEDLCYTCSVCGQEFYRTDYYKEHMVQHGASFESSNEPVASDNQEKCSQPEQKTEVFSGIRRKKIWTPKPTTVPCKICGKSIFNRTYNIKRHAQQHSILEWESILDSPTSLGRKPQGRTSTSSQLSVHCGVCGLTFKSYTLKRRHMLKHRSCFTCRACHEKFDSGAELVAHNQVCKKDGASLSGPSRQPSKRTLERGPTWRKQASEEAFAVKKWTCPVCAASIIHTTQNISRHMRELHSEGQPHSCPKCHRTYSSFHKMHRHLKSHGDTGGICHVCGKVFQTKAALRGHTKLHATPEGMFQCPHCPTSFRFQGRLEKHMRKHAEQTDVCPHCGKVYISKVHLQRHISVVHLGVKDYRHKCNQCGAQFFESVQLRDHIAYRHEGVQLYTCKFCHKGFNCRPTMVRHERKEHTNYLPYKCKHCSQGFPEKSKLVAHEMTHTGMSPHKCDICSKYFTTGSALKAHRNLHLGVKPFACSLCGKTYLKNWHLQQHVRKAHQVLEVMVCDLADHSRPDQALGDQAQSSAVMAGGEAKLLQTSVQGQYIHMQAAEGGSLQQAGANANLLQGHGPITVQQAVVYQ